MNQITSRTNARGSLARALLNKMLEDQHDSNLDHSCWYSVNLEKISPSYRNLFCPFNEDSETKKFILQSREKSDFLLTQIFHLAAKFFLTFFMTNTSANGLLNRGSMFVLSSEQFMHFFDLQNGILLDDLLDLGAGDGMVTQKLSGYFKNVFVTEMSKTMVWRLQEKGFQVLPTDSWYQSQQMYDVISCLNLLDRCDFPLELLENIRSRLKPKTGRLLLALVLPLNPYNEYNSSHKPKQKMDIIGKSFEEQMTSLVSGVLEPLGFSLEKFTKAPYLCEGDLQHSYYVLYDVILLLKSK